MLSRGEYALVDDCDYGYLNKYRWFYSKRGYAVSHMDDYKKMFYMHRIITNAPLGMDVDHKNHDPLDNRRCNLLVCTHARNMQNTSKRSHNKSGYLGVCWHKQLGKWRATITIDGVYKHLGVFNNIDDAIKARKNAEECLYA